MVMILMSFLFRSLAHLLILLLITYFRGLNGFVSVGDDESLLLSNSLNGKISCCVKPRNLDVDRAMRQTSTAFRSEIEFIKTIADIDEFHDHAW